MEKYGVCITALIIIFSGMLKPVYAEVEGHNSSLQAHEHGLSELTIVMENETLAIQITSPAMNLVGFEHKASSSKDIAAIDKATSLLHQHATLFVFSGNQCNHEHTSIDTSSLLTNTKHDHEHHHHHEDHAPKESPSVSNHGEENHSEIVVNYQYSCSNKAAPSAITVNLFKVFSGIHKIQTMWVNQSQQGATTLTAKDHIVKFNDNY